MTVARLEGGRDLDRALGELPKATARNVLRRVLRKAAQPVDDRMATSAPRETGALQLSVHIGTRLTGRQARDARREGKHFSEVHVGTSDPAGMFQEFGTFKEPPQPWARPAWEATKDDALEIIGKELGAEIRKAADRLARKAGRSA